MPEKKPGSDSQKEGRMLGIFEALSSGIRLEIFRLLVTHEPKGLVAGEISGAVGIPPTNLSFHLKAMTQAGLLSVTPEGRFLRYRARIGAVEEVIAYLTENCCKNTGGPSGTGGCSPSSPPEGNKGASS
ncbi:MAG: metalloregulator ArsR/SmtB family transcription factor [Nitrospiraceae bacterium]|nr:metalloregulator ArsR/SmtB family transcription factor [Nitrospiraceae bacterium]